MSAMPNIESLIARLEDGADDQGRGVIAEAVSVLQGLAAAAASHQKAAKVCCQKFETCREQCVPLVDALRTRGNTALESIDDALAERDALRAEIAALRAQEPIGQAGDLLFGGLIRSAAVNPDVSPGAKLYAHPAPAATDQPAPFLFVAMDDDKRATLTWCQDEAAVRHAVRAGMFFPRDGQPLDADHEDELSGVVDELLDSGAMVFEGDAPLYLYRVAGVDRPVPAQPAADRLSKSDSDYWLSVRSQVIHALNERGLTIMSDKDRVWLHESHPAAANEPACISGHIYQGFCPSDTDPGSRDLECPACRKMVEAKPAADEWRDAVEDALSTVHMTANGSTPREAVAALLKVHASIALDQRLSSAADAQALRDAERYRWLRYRTKGLLEAAGAQYFAFPYRFDLPPVGDLMRGSVAQHLDNAIDAALGIDSKEAQK